MAVWGAMPSLQVEGSFDACGARPIRLQHLSLSVLGNKRHNFSRQPFAALEVVFGDLSDDRIQEGNFRLPSTTHHQSDLQNRLVPLSSDSRCHARGKRGKVE